MDASSPPKIAPMSTLECLVRDAEESDELGEGEPIPVAIAVEDEGLPPDEVPILVDVPPLPVELEDVKLPGSVQR